LKLKGVFGKTMTNTYTLAYGLSKKLKQVKMEVRDAFKELEKEGDEA
jgi:hypothetical protein